MAGTAGTAQNLVCERSLYPCPPALCSGPALNESNASGPVRTVSVSVWTGRPVESPSWAGSWGSPAVPSGAWRSRPPARRW